MNILTDILSLIRQGVFSKIAEKNDVLVLGKWNETPDMTGVASPIPYKAVKLIKVSDFKIAAEHCGYKNSPIIPIGDTAGVYQKTVVDETTEECTVYFRKLKSLSSNLTLALSADDDYIEITTEGEPNTAANVGTGTGLWKNKVGETLNFKSLLPGNNITITENVNEISISSSASSITLADNVGTGFGIYKDKVGETLNFKSLISSDNSIVITETTNEINLASTNSGANFGLVYQIPITNALVDNFNYDSGFTYDGSRLLAEGTGTNSVSIGTDTVGSGDGSIAIGRHSTATAQGAIVMGYHTASQTNSVANSFELAWNGSTRFKLGNTVPLTYTWEDSATNTSVEVARFNRTSTSTPTDNIGSYIAMGVKGADATISDLKIEHKLYEPDTALENSLFTVYGIHEGVSNTRLMQVAAGDGGPNNTWGLITIGAGASSLDNRGIAIGLNASIIANGTGGIAIGQEAGTASSTGQVAISIGNNANGLSTTIGTASIAIGSSANSRNDYSIAIGTSASAQAIGAITIGRYSTATAQGAIIMGYHSSTQTNSLEDSFKLAWDGNAAFHVIGGASKVNYLQIDSSLTTVSPIISAVGTDTNINLTLTPKGTGTVAITGTLDALNHDIKNVKSFTANSQVSGNLSGASPVIADFSTSNFQRKTITSNVTGAPTIIDPLGPTNLVLVLVQGTGGNMTINAWQPGVYWPGGIKPVLSTAAGAIDVISFYFDGTSYFGFYGLNFS